MTRTCRSQLALVVLIAGAAQQSLAQDSNPPAYKPAANANEAVARIEELGGVVRYVSRKSDSLEVDFQFSSKTVTDAHLRYLHQLKKVTILRLKNTRITDAGLTHVSKITTLKRLYLEKTTVTDAGIQHLASMQELTYLNLYGTAVSDTGLEILKKLTQLEQLFIGQTKVTKPPLSACRSRLPSCKSFPTPHAIARGHEFPTASPKRLSHAPSRHWL